MQAEFPFQDYELYGPYFHKKEGRYYVNLYKAKYNRTTLSYARYLMSVKLGRILYSWEDVDHKDENKLNDNIDNLQILIKRDNIRKSNRKRVEVTCFVCSTVIEKQLSKVRKHNYCSPKCQNKGQSILLKGKVLKGIKYG